MEGAPQAFSSGAKSALFAGYQPPAGLHDEMVFADGAVRNHWAGLVSAFEEMGRDALAARFARADRYLRDAGVYYRVYGQEAGQEREWPLAHVPVLLTEDDWWKIAEGLAQRADLLEALLADFYGENTLAARGIVPPGLIAASPEYLRPMAGAMPAGGHFLHFCAFELGRGADGEWRVLADRTQAPSGAGFALENRVATTRALAELIAELNVERLAGFFRDFRDALFAKSSGGRVAVLTPGIHNDAYFEHAYLARYLGIMLLEGEDLTVTGGRVMVRTVSGLKPVSVLWRRIDSAFLDPLEFNQTSRIGTPGMAEALRAGAVTMVNAAGSGLAEMRSLAAFMPAACRALRGTDLLIPNIETLWCGTRVGREYALAQFDELTIGPAHSTVPAFEETGAMVGRGALLQRLESSGEDIVAQKPLALSTTPFFNGERFEPRPLVLRAFAARTRDGWRIMPGGFARIGGAAGAASFGLQRGGRAADVWILSEEPVEPISLLAREGALRREKPGNLPSRAADNLFWLGRSIERAENAVRTLRAYHGRVADAGGADSPLADEIRAHLTALDIKVEQAIPERLLIEIDNARASAGRVRDRFSPDGWAALNDLSRTAHRFAGVVQPGEDAGRACSVLLRKLAGFSGLVHENMYRFTGWRFLEIGRRLERGIQIAWLAARLARENAPEGALEAFLEIGDSTISHRRRYRTASGLAGVLDLMVLDPHNPRSLAFQAAAVKEEVARLPEQGEEDEAATSALSREALRLDAALATLAPGEVTAEALHEAAGDLAALSDMIEERYFR